MAMLKCSICGLQKEEGIGSNLCPICGGEFLPEEEKKAELLQEETADIAEKLDEYFHPELVKSKLYQIARPAFEDENKIESVMDDIKLHLEKITKRYPGEVFSYLWEGFSSKIKSVTKARDREQSAQAMVALKAATEMADALSGRSIKESPGLGFSLITNNAVDAATYIGLAAANTKMDRARQELEAVKRANQQLRNISTGGTGASAEMVKEIDLLVFNLTDLHNAHTFVESHKEFYKDASMYDAGISFEGLNLYALLAHAATSTSGFIGDYKTLKTGIEKKDLEWILPQLEGAGYIKYLDSYYKSVCYVTTGKYESAILRQKYWETHPEEKIAEDDRKEKQCAEKYAKAETALNNGNFYEAAVTFAQIDGYRDAIQRSMVLWKEKLQTNRWSISIGSHAVTSDGRVLLSQSLGKPEVENQWKRLKDIKQLVGLGYGQYVAIDFNGLLKSYTVLKQWQPIKQLEFEKRKIIEISRVWADCIAFLLEDGTVRFFGKLEYEVGKATSSYVRKVEETPTLSGWSNVIKMELYHNSIVALRKDGTILAEGYVATYSEKFKNWKGIVDIKIGLGGSYIVARTQDGQILVAGDNPDNYNLVKTWKDVIDVYTRDSVPIGITRAGLLLWGSDKKKKSSAIAKICALRGVVSISGSFQDYIVLKADGTVYTTIKDEDYADWKNVVSVNSDFSYNYALCSNGSIEVKRGTTGEEQASQEAKSWKLFNHIDTLSKEAARIAEEKAKKAEETKKKTTKILKIAIPAVCAIIAVFLLVTRVVIPNSKYNDAVALMEAGQYKEAIAAFEAMEGYKDSDAQIMECEECIRADAYAAAEALLAAEDFDEAVTAFEALGDYKDSVNKITEVKSAKQEKENAEAYAKAEKLFANKDYENAYYAFTDLGNYKDAEQQAKNVWNADWDHGNILMEMICEKEYIGAQDAYAMIGDYDSSDETFIRLKADLEKMIACSGRFHYAGDYGKYYADVAFYLSGGKMMLQINYTNYSGSISDSPVNYADDSSEYLYVAYPVGEHTYDGKTYQLGFTIKISPEKIYISWRHSYNLLER